jgi:8-oxo-dGTP pyrophosphatase MutT (NUDIX family)
MLWEDMLLENRLEKLRLEVDRLIRDKQPEREKYFFSHLYGVSDFCALLAIRRNLDAEIAAACGMLHDIYQVTSGSTENHAVKGAEQAGGILRALGLYSDDEIALIADAISKHSDKSTIHEPMAEVLKDADIMHHCLYYSANPVPENEIERYTNILVELGCTSMDCKAYPFNTLGNYKYADIMAVYEGRWIFCKHKKRTTWENPGGHIEAGETPLEAAKRELFEETGAIEFDIEPLCDYWISGKLNGVEIAGHGQAYFANVRTLIDLPSQWEMEKICFLDAPPPNLTYPDYTREIFPLAVQKGESIIDASMERYAIPGVGGLIIKEIDKIEHILLQKRCKPNAPGEDGLLEIPAGKIRAFENIFDKLKREIKEETGLEVTEILGENKLSIYEWNNYKVINFAPFSCSQNIKGTYPIMVFVFICRVTGDLLPFSDESKDYQWMPVSEIESKLDESLQSFYPMHIDTLRKYIKY